MEKQYENPIRKPQGSAELTPYSEEDIRAKEYMRGLPSKKEMEKKENYPMKKTKPGTEMPKQQLT